MKNFRSKLFSYAYLYRLVYYCKMRENPNLTGNGAIFSLQEKRIGLVQSPDPGCSRNQPNCVCGLGVNNGVVSAAG